MQPYQPYLVELINNTFDAALDTFRDAQIETKRLYQEQFERLESQEKGHSDPSLYFQYWVDHMAGYVYGGVNLQRLQKNPEEILKGLRQNALYAYRDVMGWYFDSTEAYPLLKRYVQQVELTRMLLLELLHLLIEAQASDENL